MLFLKIQIRYKAAAFLEEAEEWTHKTRMFLMMEKEVLESKLKIHPCYSNQASKDNKL